MRRAWVVVFADLALAACEAGPPRDPPVAQVVREAAPCAAAISATGEATYYEPSGPGACSLPPEGPTGAGDPLVAALNRADYGHAAWCGACLAVAGPLGAVVVRVVDSCPGCKHGDLDLSRDAFAQIAPLSAGRTKIAWHEVACPVTGPIAYRIKPGSNPQWTAVQVRNHRYAITGLEVRDPAGGYRAIARGDDNYFVAANGLGPGPFALRVADSRGHRVEDRVALDTAAAQPGAAQPGAAQPGAAQLPACR